MNANNGHRILSASATLESAEKGYDSKRRYKRQVNLLYLFGIGGDGRGPRFYKKFANNHGKFPAFIICTEVHADIHEPTARPQGHPHK